MAHLTLEEFSDKISVIMAGLMREFLRHESDEFYKMKVTIPQSVVLSLLHTQGESKMSDLAEPLNVTTAALTGIVERLVRDGYIVRAGVPEDRRVVKVRLTDKGSKTVRKMLEDRKKMTMKMFSMISQVERETYVKILEHILHHLKESTGS